MTILCIDTATENGTVVVVRTDGSLASVCWRSGGRHAESLLGHIDSALAEAGVSRDELSLIGVDIGPGRFTSVRVGLGTAKGLALGLDVPIVGVSSLRVLARSLPGGATRVRVPVMSAYRGEVFAAAYLIEDEVVEEVLPALFGPPEEVFGRVRAVVGDRAIAVCGEGARRHLEVLESVLGFRPGEVAIGVDSATPEALVAEVRHVMRTEGPSDLGTLEPQYLHPSDARPPDRSPTANHSS
jgi:tRNA threonylcarbamoyladenosine biosynthesis protein TsaB